MHVLEDLYLGAIRPGERIGKRTPQYAKALDEAIKTNEALTASMTEEQKELFENFMDAQRELNILTDIETFIYAFRLGAKIILDILTEGKMKEI